MSNDLLACPKCKTGLSAEFFNTPDLTPCPGCRAPAYVEVFPALFQTPAPAPSGAAILTGSESSCFYHPQKKAVVPCESCGRFLCALCDVEMKGQHLCPACLSAGKKKGKLKHLQDQRVLYDSIAVAMAAYPLLLWPFTLVMAPMALYIAIRHWNAPSSLIPRSKVRFLVAIILASLELLAWAAGIIAIMTR
jgi:hypothetical protein